MSTNGHLKFQGTNRATFVGGTSNIMFDTTSTSLGIGVTGTDHPSSNLYITGNAYVSSNIAVGGVLTMGTVNVVARHDLEAVTAMGNTTPLTVEFSNATTGIVTTGNVEVGKDLVVSGNVSDLNVVSNVNMLHTANTASIKLNSNVVTEFPRSKKLIKYPRVNLTQNALNNGYTVSASSQESTNRQAWKVFNNTYAEGDGWRSGQTYSSSDGSFTGTFVDFSNGGQTFAAADQGQWVKITLPEKMRLERFKLQPRYSPTTGGATYSYGRSEFVKNGAIWGSNDGSSWDKVYTITYGVPATDTTITEFTVPNSTTAYNNFVLVVTDTHGSSAGLRASFSEWELLGVPEYDPDAYGTDVVVKSVPNVPNTDWLEVYYDAKGLTPGAVGSSISGLGGTTISATKLGDPQVSNDAFVFDGSGDAIVSGATSLSGNPPLSYSVWFKTNSISSGTGSNSIVQIGYSASYKSLGFRIRGLGETTKPGNYRFYVWTGATGEPIDTDIKAEIGTWTHATVVYDGLNSKLYIDGKFAVENTNTATNLALDSGAKVALGNYIDSSGALWSGGDVRDYDGSIANFRLFNRVLATDEIYQLYAYQKEYFGHGDLSMTLKAGRLGIGTSEPRAVLDVKGDTFSRVYKGGRTTFLTWDYVGQRSTSFSAAGSTHGAPSDSTILDYTFTIPSCYHHLEKANLKAHVQIDWRGECEEPWNFGFRIEIRYNGESQLVNSSESDHSSTSGNKINGLPCISYYANANFDSTPEAASVTSTFALPNCDVSPGSTLKVGLVGRNGVNVAKTVWTGRVKGFSTSSPAHELPTTSFFVVLDVDDGY